MIKRLQGRDLMAFTLNADTQEYVVVGYATDTTLNIDVDMIETTNPLSGRAKTYKPGRYTWTMDISRLYTEGTGTGDADSSAIDEFNSLKRGDVINIGFSKRGELWEEQSETWADNYKRFYGTAYIKSIRINAPVNGLANYSLTLQGSGELSAEPDSYWHRTPPRG